MTLLIDLSREQQQRLEDAAQQRGVEPAQYAREILLENLRIVSTDAPAAAVPSAEGSLLDLLGDYVGAVELSDPTLSTRTSEAFGESLERNRRDAHL